MCWVSLFLSGISGIESQSCNFGVSTLPSWEDSIAGCLSSPRPTLRSFVPCFSSILSCPPPKKIFFYFFRVFFFFF